MGNKKQIYYPVCDYITDYRIQWIETLPVTDKCNNICPVCFKLNNAYYKTKMEGNYFDCYYYLTHRCTNCGHIYHFHYDTLVCTERIESD